MTQNRMQNNKLKTLRFRKRKKVLNGCQKDFIRKPFSLKAYLCHNQQKLRTLFNYINIVFIEGNFTLHFTFYITNILL